MSKLNVYKVLFRVFHNTKPIKNYQNIQLITLLHEDKLGKNKNKKIKDCRGCDKIGKVATASSTGSAFGFFYSEALNCY